MMTPHRGPHRAGESAAQDAARDAAATRFYAEVLDEAVLAAAERAGVEEDIGVLRARLREQLRGQQDDLRLTLRAAEVLLKALAVRHRISGKRADDALEHVKAVLDHFADVVGGEE